MYYKMKILLDTEDSGINKLSCEIVSFIYDREASLRNCQNNDLYIVRQYGLLNRTRTIIIPVDIPMWMREITQSSTHR